MDNAKKFATCLDLHADSNHDIYEQWRAHKLHDLDAGGKARYKEDASMSRRIYNRAFFSVLQRTTYEQWNAVFSGFSAEFSQHANELFLILVKHRGNIDLVQNDEFAQRLSVYTQRLAPTENPMNSEKL